MAKTIMFVILIGFGLVFIPLVIIGLTFLNTPGVNWETIGQQVAYPILAIFILGICVFFLKQHL